MQILCKILIPVLTLSLGACAHKQTTEEVTPAEAAKVNRKLVREAVVFESGAKDGAVVPELSAPLLRAIMVPERIENNRLIEAHREWLLEGDVTLLGIPAEKPTEKYGKDGGKRK